MAEIQGQRLPDSDEPIHKVLPLPLGGYCKVQGVWWILPPKTGVSTGYLGNHTVTEHEDGTITVSPSILVEGGNTGGYHGYLEHGVWRDA